MHQRRHTPNNLINVSSLGDDLGGEAMQRRGSNVRNCLPIVIDVEIDSMTGSAHQAKPSEMEIIDG